eukprot:CAMPEP_0116103494 /NCGR_PEP_ID=MMETSP0327-20121206/13914_1 /TAXON_ID=44447 /ORGANISM="Pseudo-nitzschia delicatissima, Strain B596" /LENGTH=317 /DNA_ID=CAMNT_0003595607 /DNA_START=37 /DNA_END=990 /DNA_ORIENTATION=+
MEDFSNKFEAEAAATADSDTFDPFGIGVVATESNASDTSPKAASTNGFAAADDTKSSYSAKSNASLPPKVTVKFMIEEEVSSIAHLSNVNEGSSDVQIEGKVLAQVVSSDASKNIPFCLTASSDNQETVDIIPDGTYAKKDSDATTVNIPKETLEFVNLGTYRISQSMEHMPLLLEQKVVRSKSNIQIAIQVRSKLSNPDDLHDFSIALYIPKKVDGKSVSDVTGDGNFDLWKRCITWEKTTLPKGQSFMVSAKCEVSSTADLAEEDEDLNFPVMMRCRSKDQMSSLRLQAVEANGHAASVSSSVAGKSYRIVHRLK